MTTGKAWLTSGLFLLAGPVMAELKPGQGYGPVGGIGGGMMGGMGMEMGGWFWGFVMAGILLALVFAAFAGMRMARGGGARGVSALDILEQRFATGEIDEAEFRKRKDALQR